MNEQIKKLQFGDLKSLVEIIKELQQKRRVPNFLIGNGFSISYDYDIFSYNALSTYLYQKENKVLEHLFESTNTKNFEQVMNQLDTFIKFIDIFEIDDNKKNLIIQTKETLKNSLIESVGQMHPEHVYSIPDEKVCSCFQFLKYFINNNGLIFSTNYDLLLYWVLMRQKSSYDGFGRKHEDDFELYWGNNKDIQKVFYLHGALHLFDNGYDILKETYSSKKFLIDNIKSRIENNQYPIFVTAGDKDDKKEQIGHNRYLNNCFEKLSNISGSLITLGFNFSKNDEHIIDAINNAHSKDLNNRLHSIYVGVYSEEDFNYILGIKDKFKCKVNLYNSNIINIWDYYTNVDLLVEKHKELEDENAIENE